MPLAGQRWVAPQTNADRQNWKSPSAEIVEKGKAPLLDPSLIVVVPDTQKVNEPEVTEIVMSEQKRKRVDGDAGRCDKVTSDMDVETVEPKTGLGAADLIRAKRPKVVFLIETFMTKQRMEPIRARVGFQNMFVVDACGHRGGLVLLWHEAVELEVTGFSSNHIDSIVILDIGSPKWRFTGYYGYPERSRRRESWQLLRTLASLSTMPWVVMGDYNDLMHQGDKRGRHPQPTWLLNGFTEAIADCGLQEFEFSGNQFTWERSRGTPDMVEEKLDRIFTTDSWLSLFEGAKACSLACPYSDHVPLLLTPVVVVSGVRRRRIETCGSDIWRWGKTYNKEFQRQIDAC
nr:uncharacterized protein LOC109162272 [Ipomoea batatas]GME15660.1 uncharacterized protein LOC109162272 [Ipomoea batatas]